MTCSCGSNRLMQIDGKCSDLSGVQIPHMEINHDGYMISGLNVGGGDYISFEVCLDCGKIQADWPLTDTGIKKTMVNEGVIEPDEDDELIDDGRVPIKLEGDFSFENTIGKRLLGK